MFKPILIGTGVYTPKETISNDELVQAFNAYVEKFNHDNALEIEAGRCESLLPSDSGFIEKASGIKSRYVVDKQGILDPNIMHPVLEERPDDALSYQAEFALHAAEKAVADSGIDKEHIGAVICACSNMQRAYPAMAIEVQQALGLDGFAYDMNVACSSATFAIQLAESLVRTGTVKAVLIVNPEICSAHLNFKDRDSHFIFGDVATAMVIAESSVIDDETKGFEIISCLLKTQFSNNIRNNGGFMNRLSSENAEEDKLFYQNGRKVFKEVTGEVLSHVGKHLANHQFKISDLNRFWLHQANANMNRLIASKLLGFEPDHNLAPVILDRYANTASAGSIIAFDHHHKDFKRGQLGLICSFGAGYSIGSVIVAKR